MRVCSLTRSPRATAHRSPWVTRSAPRSECCKWVGRLRTTVPLLDAELNRPVTFFLHRFPLLACAVPVNIPFSGFALGRECVYGFFAGPCGVFLAQRAFDQTDSRLCEVLLSRPV